MIDRRMVVAWGSGIAALSILVLVVLKMQGSSGVQEYQLRGVDEYRSEHSEALADREAPGKPGRPVSTDAVSVGPKEAYPSGLGSGDSGKALPSGFLEGALIPDGEALSYATAGQILGSEGFAEFVVSLEANAKSRTVAADLSDSYRLGIDKVLAELPGGTLDSLGCGERVCAMQVTSAAGEAAFDAWLSRAFSSSGLPGYSLIQAGIPVSSNVTAYRVIVTIDPSASAIAVPSPPAGG